MEIATRCFRAACLKFQHMDSFESYTCSYRIPDGAVLKKEDCVRSCLVSFEGSVLVSQHGPSKLLEAIRDDAK